MWFSFLLQMWMSVTVAFIYFSVFYLTLSCVIAPTTKEGKCKRDPPCDLWDEELLLEEQERRHYQAVAPIAHVQPAVPAARVVNYDLLEGFNNDLDWMDNPRMSFGL